MSDLIIRIVHDPVTASYIQSIIYISTLWALLRQLAAQNKAIALQTQMQQETEYLRCQTDFTESMRLLVRSGMHATIYDELALHGYSKFVGWKNYNSDQKALYAYFELLYELFERVYVVWQNKWIKDDEWKVWHSWILDVMGHQLFEDVCKDSLGMFDPNYEKYIARTIATHPSKLAQMEVQEEGPVSTTECNKTL